jgi:hypothetical protein
MAFGADKQANGQCGGQAAYQKACAGAPIAAI